jgi:hypothetical protein
VRGSRLHLITLVPVRPRRCGERRLLRTSLLPGASLRPTPLAFNPDTPRRLSTPTLLTPFDSAPTFARAERPSSVSCGRCTSGRTTRCTRS